VRRLVVLLGLCGCNQVFGLSDTTPIDSLEVVTTCPAIGQNPTYAPILNEALMADCYGYILDSAGEAFAFCQDDTGGSSYFASGPPAGALTMLAGFTAPAGSYFTAGLFAQDAGEVLATVTDISGENTVRIYHPQSAGSWSYAADLALLQYSSFSAPTSAPGRHIASIDANGVLHEIAEQSPDVWSDLGTAIQPADLGVAVFMGPPSLSPDGLRLVVQAATTPTGAPLTYYSDRPALGAPFRALSPLTGVPVLDDTSNGNYSIAPDCSRIYFSSNKAVFFAQQD